MARNQFPFVTYYNPQKAYDGYTLFAPKGGSEVWLIDMEGRFVHHWEMDLNPGEYGTLLPDGHLLYAGRLRDRPLEFDGAGGKLVEVDWDGNIVWRYDDPYMHHDFCRMDNGNTMVLRWGSVPHDIAFRVKGGGFPEPSVGG